MRWPHSSGLFWRSKCGPFAGTGTGGSDGGSGSGKTLADIIQDYQEEADALRMGYK